MLADRYGLPYIEARSRFRARRHVQAVTLLLTLLSRRRPSFDRAIRSLIPGFRPGPPTSADKPMFLIGKALWPRRACLEGAKAGAPALPAREASHNSHSLICVSRPSPNPPIVRCA